MSMSKVAVVTGASRGIGRAIALRLAKDGYAVAVNYVRNREKAEEVVAEIMADDGTAKAFQADVGRFEEAKALLDGAVAEFGRIDLLVNNAGITADGLVARMKESQFDEVLQANLKSAFNCARHAAPLMMKQRSGCIVNLSSVAGILGNAGQANYAASKAGVIGLTKALARELAGRNIRVNAVAPGYIQTDMTEALPASAKEALLNMVPLKKMGEPGQVADVVAFLASEQAAYITGQVLCVDGGMAM